MTRLILNDTEVNAIPTNYRAAYPPISTRGLHPGTRRETIILPGFLPFRRGVHHAELARLPGLPGPGALDRSHPRHDGRMPVLRPGVHCLPRTRRHAGH